MTVFDTYSLWGLHFLNLNYNVETDVHIVSSWQVTKIISPSGKELNFNFFDDDFISASPINYEHTLVNTVYGTGTRDWAYGNGLYEIVTATQTMSSNLYQDEIENPLSKEKVKFYISDREDIMQMETAISFRVSNTARGWIV